MKVTIITVNLNGNRFLPSAIDSVLAQDCSALEYLIIDGGSTDGSLATIMAAADRDRRVRWISEPDAGISAAMNKGVAMATGDVIGFLHSDDCYPACDVLTVVADAFAAAPETQWLTGGLALISESGKVFREFPVRRYSRSRLIRSNILFHPATFVRRELLRALPFNTGLQLAMDYDLWLRLAERAEPLLIERPLAAFRIHAGSRSIRAADAALAEEFAVRCSYLNARGYGTLRCRLEYSLKRLANRCVVGRMQSQSLRCR